MADQNQTIHTVYTAEADMAAARAEMEALGKKFNAIMAQMARSVDGVDDKTLAMTRRFNRAMGTLQQAQRMMQGSVDRPSANLRKAVSDDRAAARAAQELAQAKLRLMTVEAELANLNARDGGRVPLRVSRLRQEKAEVQALISQYEAVSAVVQKYERNYAGLTRRAGIQGDRQTVTDARAYLQAQERIVMAKQRMEAHDAGRVRLGNVELANLRAEVLMTERLLRLHEQDANVMARAQQIMARRQQAGQPADPSRRMSARADLMGDYAALGTAGVAAYSLWDFAVKDESALAQFRAIAAASGSETARLSQDMKELGLNTKYSNLEIAETATLLAQAGLSASDTGPALKAIAELATAAGIELKQAADVVTSVTNIWSYNVSQMGDVANVLTSALNQTKLGMDQMQLGVQYAGNTAADAGVDFVELTSIMGAMAQAGIRSGSTIGTGLRTLLTDLQNPTEKTIKALARVGLTISDVDVRTLGLTQVLHNLKAAGFTSADAMGAFEIRAASAFAAISNNLNIVDELQGSLYDSDAAARANATQMDTLAARWNTLRNAGQSLASTALQPVIAFLKEFFVFGTNVLGMLNKMGPLIQGVTTALVVMLANFAITRLGLAIGSLGQIALGLKNVAGSAGAAAVGATAFGTALKAIPIIGWISMGVGLVTTLLSMAGAFKNNADEADLLDGAINDLQSQLMETETTIKAVDQATDRLRNRQSALMAGTKEMRDRVLEQTRLRFESLGLQIDKGSDSVEDMIDALDRLRQELNREFSSQLMTLADRLQERIDLMNGQIGSGDVLSRDEKARGRDAWSKAAMAGLTTTDAQRRLGALMRGTSTLGEDYSTDQYRADMQALREEEKGVRQRRDDARPGSRERAQLDAQLEGLTTFKVVMGRFNDFLREISQAEIQRQTTEDDARYQAALGRTGAPTDNPGDLRGLAAGVRSTVEETLQSYEPRRQAILNSGASASAQAQRLEELKNEVDLKMGQMLLQARPWVEADPEMAPFVDRFLQELNELVAGRTNTMFGSLDEIQSLAEKEDKANARSGNNARNDEQDLQRRLSDAELKDIEARMDAIEARMQRRAENGGTPEELNTLRSEWTRLNDEREVAARAAQRDRMRTSSMYDRRAGLEMPLNGAINSGWSLNRRNPVTGEMRPHQGIDIDGRTGDRVNAAGSGRVVTAGWKGGYGNTIEIEHANGLRTLYAHLSEMIVKVGDEVARGQNIGAVGSTGNSTGPHLHFGVRRNGQWVDPRSAMGQTGGTPSGDPQLNRLSELEWSRFEAENQGKRDDFERKFTEWMGQAVFEPLEAELKARRDANKSTIDAILDGIETAGSAGTSLEEVTAGIRARVQDNMTIARRLLLEDPKNAGRLDSAGLRRELTSEEIQVMQDGADAIQAAYEKFAALQERLGGERMAATQNQLRIAGATAGTSETTTWLLNQRLEMEEYQTALDVLTASEQAYTAALADRAVAEKAVADATLALQEAGAAGNQDAIVKSQQALALAQATLDRVRQTANAAGVNVLTAQQTANASTPVGPTSQYAAGATARGPQTLMAMFGSTVERYRSQSGIFADISNTITDGIYGSFDALAQGVEDTINQIADGSITIQGLFGNLLGGVFKEMQATASKIAANWIMQWLIKTIMGSLMPTVGGGGGLDAQGMSMLLSGPMPGVRMKHGGEVKRRALGGGTYGRDSVNILAEPGEITMRKSAVDFIGRDTLLSLNALGNRRLSAAGARMPAMPAPREPDYVNVWVVDRQQVPPPSKKDIIHAVGESMMGGELKQLVKQVQLGA